MAQDPMLYCPTYLSVKVIIQSKQPQPSHAADATTILTESLVNITTAHAQASISSENHRAQVD